MKFFLKLMLFMVTLSAGTAYSQAVTTCTGADFMKPLCDFTPAAERCDTLQAAKAMAQMMCSPATCPPSVGGGCMGTLGSFNWFPVSIDGLPYRCACGCVAEETVFATDKGNITAKELIAIRKSAGKTDALFESNQNWNGGADIFAPIDGITFGPERELASTFLTASGRTVTVSASHPVVVIVDQNNAVEEMRAARQIEAGMALVDKAGNPDPIVHVKRASYEGQMVNFRVETPTRLVYPNSFKMGDHAWQQYLARAERGLLTIGDIIAAIEKAK